MKVKEEHRVPLSPPALALLKGLPREASDPRIFPISSMAMFRVLRSLRDDVTVHGFRATFSTWANESTSYLPLVIEMSLSHSVGSKVEAAYRRTDLFDKRRKLMESWAKHCEATPAATGAVVPMRSARR
jgi:integrase